MKRTIRYGTFESNSSSMHSMIVMKESGPYTKEEIMSDVWLDNGGTIFLDRYNDLMFGRYPFQILCTFYDKLRYAIASFCGGWGGAKDAKKEFIKIEEIISAYIPGFTGFMLDSDDDYPYGNVDHQSDGLLQRFLAEKHISLEEFLTHREYMVVIDGDEYFTFEEYMNHHIIDANSIAERFR